MSKTLLAGMSLRALDASRGIRVGRSIIAAVMMALVMTWAAPASARSRRSAWRARRSAWPRRRRAAQVRARPAETPGKPTDPNATAASRRSRASSTAEPIRPRAASRSSRARRATTASPSMTRGGRGRGRQLLGELVAAIDPPPPLSRSADVGKKKCVAKYLAALLKCQSTGADAGQAHRSEARLRRQGEGEVRRRRRLGQGVLREARGEDAGTTARPWATRAPFREWRTTCVASFAALLTSPSTTTTTTTGATTTTTQPASAGGVLLKGALTATPGRFNYNAQLGLPGANAACNTNFPGTHACTYAELQSCGDRG